jgi:hypothetical protein
VDYNVHEGWNYHKWSELANQPKNKAFRFKGSGPGSCIMREIKFAGVKSIDSNANAHKCPTKLFLDDVSQDVNEVEYKGQLTPTLDEVTPRFGTVKGGTQVTFTGKQFSANKADYLITLDNIVCPVDSATSTSVTCTTAKRPGLPPFSQTIYIKGQGYVSNQGVKFTYVNVWSHTETWGGEFAPVDGESIYVPKGLNLLVDIKTSPILNLVIVEGEIIFAPEVDPKHKRTFDCHYIFMNKGKM